MDQARAQLDGFIGTKIGSSETPGTALYAEAAKAEGRKEAADFARELRHLLWLLVVGSFFALAWTRMSWKPLSRPRAKNGRLPRALPRAVRSCAARWRRSAAGRWSTASRW